MILSELNNMLVNVANGYYLVNEAFVGDVYTINSKENRFACFVATPMNAAKTNVGTIRYSYYLYYIDRLTKQEDNIDFVQSDAVSVLKGIIEFLGQNEVEIEEGYEFTLFRQKFSDWCAGAYVSVNFIVPDNDCSEWDFHWDNADLRPLSVNRNGIYLPHGFDGYDKVVVDVPQTGVTPEWVDNEIDSKISGYATQSWVQNQGYVTSAVLTGYATESWVLSQGYITSEELPEDIATKSWVQDQGYLTSIPSTYATQSWVSSNFLSTTALTGYATETWVLSQGYITSETIPEDIATQSWVQAQGYITSEELPEDIATKSWVQDQGYLKSIPSDYVTYSWISSQEFATESWVLSQGYITSETIPEDIATQSWVMSQGFLTSIPSDYVTSSWVISQGYITSSALSGYATEYFVTHQGYITSTALYGYATESWVKNQGYLTSSTIPSEYVTQSYLELNEYIDEPTLEYYALHVWSLVSQGWVESQGYITSAALTGYATESWVESQGYLTSVPSEYVTESWISSQQFATISYVGSQISDVESWVRSNYATKSWVSSQNFATVSYVDSQISDTKSWADAKYFKLSRIWTGTKSNWDNLTTAEKATYTIALIKP